MGIRRLSGLVPGFSASAPVHQMQVGLDATDYSAGVSLSAGTWTAPLWSKVDRDSGGWWDGTAYDWTPTHTGLYVIHAQAKHNADEYGGWRLYDETGAAYIIRMFRQGGDDSRSTFATWQFWLEGGNAYSVQLYTSSASLYYADSYTMVSGPYVTDGGS